MSFLGFSKKKEKEKGAQEPLPEKQTFSDLMRGLQYSVNAAQQVLERHHLYLLGKYIDKLGRPKTQRIRLNDSKVVDIPLLAYMNQGALGIDELELEFSAKVDASTVKQMRENAAGKQETPFDIERSCFEMNFTPSEREGDVMHVKIKFKNRDVPEGVARLTDELNKEIYPKPAVGESDVLTVPDPSEEASSK